MEDLSKYKLCNPGDLVMNRMQAWSGMFAVSPIEGLISPDYSIFKPIDKVDVKYFEALFKTPILITQFAIRSKGIGSGFNRLYTPDFGDVAISIPPLSEQAAIVRFLDYIDKRIRKSINAKKKLIKLLEEEKQAIINQAVTRGLNPDVKMKPSGVEWLGDVPEHWDILPGRACYSEKKESNAGLKEKTVLSLSYGQIVIKPEEKLHGLVPESFETYQIVDPGDIIIRPTDLQNDWNSLRFGLSHHRGIITSAYMCFHTNEILDRSFGHLLLHTYDLKKIFYGLGSGLRQNLDWKDFKYLPCCVPSLPEQKEIVKFLDKAAAKIDKVIDTEKSKITLLNEYRTRFISDVVTGKIDVREAAAGLPEETEEPEEIEEIEPFGDPEDCDGIGEELVSGIETDEV